MASRLRLKGSHAFMALVVALVGGFEGLRLTAYRDITGVPTVCYGETRGVQLDDHYTPGECRAMLGASLLVFEQGMRGCLTSPDTIPDKPYASFISLTYNIGVGGFCKSTVARRANSGDIAGACRAIPLWNKAGGKVVPGLVKRRAAEEKLCLEGVGGTVTLAEAEPLAPVTEAPPANPVGNPPAEPAGADPWVGWLIGGGFAVIVLGGLAIMLWRRKAV